MGAPMRNTWGSCFATRVDDDSILLGGSAGWRFPYPMRASVHEARRIGEVAPIGVDFGDSAIDRRGVEIAGRAGRQEIARQLDWPGGPADIIACSISTSAPSRRIPTISRCSRSARICASRTASYRCANDCAVLSLTRVFIRASVLQRPSTLLCQLHSQSTHDAARWRFPHPRYLRHAYTIMRSSPRPPRHAGKRRATQGRRSGR